ncbi:hypothetical protein KIPB_011701 [Kipferlia bialata]|uniref:SNARE-complex protein Syntaxin-18 N-terminal domain-containing protein n=1 Tax=Kipferlia bialata TaxID=797122 RepID=A0A9K3D6Y3_9EUKA|nr:hypothetical protein KIPB_011701 [Kipferlia bialata]|eukprot:g11701.t1
MRHGTASATRTLTESEAVQFLRDMERTLKTCRSHIAEFEGALPAMSPSHTSINVPLCHSLSVSLSLYASHVQRVIRQMALSRAESRRVCAVDDPIADTVLMHQTERRVLSQREERERDLLRMAQEERERDGGSSEGDEPMGSGEGWSEASAVDVEAEDEDELSMGDWGEEEEDEGVGVDAQPGTGLPLSSIGDVSMSEASPEAQGAGPDTFVVLQRTAQSVAVAQGVERTAVEITSLGKLFSEHLLAQAEQIEAIYATAVAVQSNFEAGNASLVSAARRLNSATLQYVILLLVCTLCLFLVDWIN